MSNETPTAFKLAHHRRAQLIPALWLGQVRDLLSLWRKRVRQRRELLDLDPHLMRDAGIDPETIRRVSAKHFWQP
jgi:uncharacterized protein YjiS (DUF1127 family)